WWGGPCLDPRPLGLGGARPAPPPPKRAENSQHSVAVESAVLEGYRQPFSERSRRVPCASASLTASAVVVSARPLTGSWTQRAAARPTLTRTYRTLSDRSPAKSKRVP